MYIATYNRCLPRQWSLLPAVVKIKNWIQRYWLVGEVYTPRGMIRTAAKQWRVLRVQRRQNPERDKEELLWMHSHNDECTNLFRTHGDSRIRFSNWVLSVHSVDAECWETPGLYTGRMGVGVTLCGMSLVCWTSLVRSISSLHNHIKLISQLAQTSEKFVQYGDDCSIWQTWLVSCSKCF